MLKLKEGFLEYIFRGGGATVLVEPQSFKTIYASFQCSCRGPSWDAKIIVGQQSIFFIFLIKIKQ